ncbi:MAG TPA: ribose 5-phosphate isomerase B [Smithellaceae bacterium]|jgi:ribose 5-phosphate isomerase B|nr:ribose 5-phosphate isomerase B [Smithellaceae bacterium]HQF84630.1 ribose 5-phosphate isomerase B [Smithellaceae bacterium]HQG81399.1 ribose 5-phosphate isomerase B [Smithellaceae bacterium]
MKKIVIAGDHGALELKETIVQFLKKKFFSVIDLGTFGSQSVDYPDMAKAACDEFNKGGYEFGILLCGTGIGISMAANKIKGIRCALISDLFTAQMAKAHNNANFIAFGGRVHYNMPVTEMIDKFIGTEYEGGRHDRRIAKLAALEDQC